MASPAAKPLSAQAPGGALAQETRDWAKRANLHVKIDQLIRDLFDELDKDRRHADRRNSVYEPPEKFDFEQWLLKWIQKNRSRRSTAGSQSAYIRLKDSFQLVCGWLFQSSKQEYAQTVVEYSRKAAAESAPSDIRIAETAYLQDIRSIANSRLMKIERDQAPKGGVGDLLRIAAEKNRFDATDDVQGIRVEAAPQPMDYYPQGYNPLKDPLQVVAEMKNWHDPRGRLWASYAIDALTANSRRMITQHSQGEPREVVVPLFTYSTFFFHRKLWAVWIPFQGGGKWRGLPAGLMALIERDIANVRPKDSTQSDQSKDARAGESLDPDGLDKSEFALTSALSGDFQSPSASWFSGEGALKLAEGTLRSLNRTIAAEYPTRELLDRDGEPFVYHDKIVFPQCLTNIVHEGRDNRPRKRGAVISQDSAPAECWAGLDVWCGWATFQATRRSLGSRKSEVASSLNYVFLAKYSVPRCDATGHEVDADGVRTGTGQRRRLGTLEHPLHDNVGWLPMPVPGALFKFPKKSEHQIPSAAEQGDQSDADAEVTTGDNLGEYYAYKGTSFVRPGSRGTPFSQTPFLEKVYPEIVSLDSFPPPGLLEYVHSKRSVETLTLTDTENKQYMYEITPLSTPDWDSDVQGLKDKCLKRKNQAKYDAELCKDLKSLLKDLQGAADADQRFALPNVLRSVTAIKIAGDVGVAESDLQPSPLSIAHSLDIQIIKRYSNNAQETQQTGISSPRQRDARGVSWRDRPDREWAVAFSGKPYAIYGKYPEAGKAPDCADDTDEIYRCLPWFRLYCHFEDQPYWHLNAAMRSLQLGPKKTYVGVKQDSKKPDRIKSALEGDYDARDPSTIGTGLSAMAVSFNTEDQSEWGLIRRKRLKWPCGRTLRVVFKKKVSQEFRSCDGRHVVWMTVHWKDPAAESWCTQPHKPGGAGFSSSLHMDCDMAPDGDDQALVDTLPPYEHTWRNMDSPRAGDAKAHWQLQGIRLTPMSDPWPLQPARQDPPAGGPARPQGAAGQGTQAKDRKVSVKQTAKPVVEGDDPPLQQPPSDQLLDSATAPVACAAARARLPDGMFDADLGTLPVECWLSLGPWLLDQCRPLLWQIDKALYSLSPMVNKTLVKPEGKLLVYRGLRDAKLDAKVYAHGNVLLWGQFSSTSTNQGVAQSFADGRNASVFTLQGEKCRLIAPWSRFGREEEWLFPPNSFWLVKAMLTEEQQQILDKSGIQLYEMDEVVTDEDMACIQVRYSLKEADSVASASVIFQAESAVKSGGFINLSLDGQADDGSTRDSWIYHVSVVYDGWHKCPLKTNTQWMSCDTAAASTLFNMMVAGETTGESGTAAEADKAGTAVERGIYTRDKNSVVLDNLDKILNVHAEEAALVHVPAHRAHFRVRVYDTRRGWDAQVTIRKREGRPARAIGDPGAFLLAEILHRGVKIKNIDVRNNNITRKGTRALLEAMRSNIHVRMCQLGTVSSADGKDGSPRASNGKQHLKGDSPLSEEEEARAITIRGLHNLGRISADKMEAFGPRWKDIAAYALYDCDSINVDFAGLFERDRRQGNKRPCEFIQQVFDYRFKSPPERYDAKGETRDDTSEHKKKQHDLATRKITLRGALVAACTFADPEQVIDLLDLKAQGPEGPEGQRAEVEAMDPRETDQFGESPVVKARRRLDRARLEAGLPLAEGTSGEVPGDQLSEAELPREIQQWTTVINRLVENVAKTQQVRPDSARFDHDADPDEVYWGLKHFGLLAMRTWETKMRGGGDLTDELVHGLRHHFDAPHDLKLKTLADRLHDNILHNNRGKDSAFGKTPVERVHVSLLCYALFIYTNDQFKSSIAEALKKDADLHAEDAAVQGTPAAVQEKDADAYAKDGGNPDGIPKLKEFSERELDVAGTMRMTSLALFDPQGWAMGKTQHMHRETLRRWVLSWALLNCTIAACDEQLAPCEKPFVKRIDDIPAEAFAKLVTLRRGKSFGMAHGALWTQQADKEKCCEKEKGAAASDSESKGDGRLDSSITVTVSGQYQGVAAQELFLKEEGQLQSEQQTYTQLPCLMYNLVGDTDASDKKSVIEVNLMTRGSLLSCDPELVTWRDTVLLAAVESERRLLRKKQEEWMSPDVTYEDEPKEPSDGSVCRKDVFFSRRVELADEGVKERVKKRNIDEVLQSCHKWERMIIRNTSGSTWDFASLYVERALPYMMRPACTLLHQLKRDRKNVGSALSKWYRNVALSPAIFEQSDKNLVVVDHEKIDEYCENCRTAEPPEVDDDLATAVKDRASIAGLKREDIPTGVARSGDLAPGKEVSGEAHPLNTLSAQTVFGKGQFCITVGELQQLVRSTQVTTIATFPRRFYQELCRRFTFNPRYMSEMQRKRFLPLHEVAGISKTTRQKPDLRGQRAPERAREEDRGNAPRTAPAEEIEGLAPKEVAEKVQEQRKQDTRQAVARANDQETKDALSEFHKEVVQSFAWYGFRSEAEARCLMAMSVAQLANAMCISQKGYFLTSGNSEAESPAVNQICSKSDSPVVFLCAAVIDFYDDKSAEVEYDRYLTKGKGDAAGYDFKMLADMALYQRIRAQYECIFKAARSQGVRNPSMIALGCGQALKALSGELRQKVQKMYFNAQFELLSREDWGFENYYINAQSKATTMDMMRELRMAHEPNGACNSTEDRRWLRCNVIFHQKDAKIVAQRLAEQGRSPAFLVPTDTEALLLGQCGGAWEVGRLQMFQVAQDWAATSTGILGSFSICGPVLGFDDIVLLLQSGGQLRLCTNEGQLLCVEEDTDGASTTFGPFCYVEYRPRLRELEVDTDRRDPHPGGKESKPLIWKIARVQHRVLLRELARILHFARAKSSTKGKSDKGIQVVVPTQTKELVEGKIHEVDEDHSLTLRGITLTSDDQVWNELRKCGVKEHDVKWLTRKGVRTRAETPDAEKPEAEKAEVGDMMVDNHWFLVEFHSLDALLRAMARLPLDKCATFYDGKLPLAVEGGENKECGVLSRHAQGIAEQRKLVGTVQQFDNNAVRNRRPEDILTLSNPPFTLRRHQRCVLRFPQELSRDTRIPSTLRPAWTLLRLLKLAEVTTNQLGSPFNPLANSWKQIEERIKEHLQAGTDGSKRLVDVDKDGRFRSLCDEKASRIRWPGYRVPCINLKHSIECLALQEDKETVQISGAAMDQTVRELPADVWYEEQCMEEEQLLMKYDKYKKQPGKHTKLGEQAYYEEHSSNLPGAVTTVNMATREKTKCATEIFGSGRFTIEIAEICDLVQTATLFTSGDCRAVLRRSPESSSGSTPRESTEPSTSAWLPHEFLTAFISRFVHNEELGPFFQMKRYQTIRELIDGGRMDPTVHARTIAEEYDKLLKVRDSGNQREKPEDFMSTRTHYWDVDRGIQVQGTGKLQQLTLTKMKIAYACQKLGFELNKEYHDICIKQISEFAHLLKENPEWLGFDSLAHVEEVLNKAMGDFATETCVAAKGYFLVGGNSVDRGEEQKEGMNQLHGRTKAPITFVSTAGIDFGTTPSTKLQAPRYFTQHEKAGRDSTLGWVNWRKSDDEDDGTRNPLGKRLLRERIRTFYSVMFSAAQKHKVNTPCMLPIGLGVFLGKLVTPTSWHEQNKRVQPLLTDFKEAGKQCRELKDKVVELYWETQIELLCERDWGFDTYYINAQQFLGIASKLLDANASKLSCNVVLHNRDVKFLAVTLTNSTSGGEPRRVCFLNPSDACAVIGGDMGMYWALGRGVDYVGEEDFAATSTGCLHNFNIAGHTLGLHDAHLLLYDEGEGEANTVGATLRCVLRRVDGTVRCLYEFSKHKEQRRDEEQDQEEEQKKEAEQKPYDDFKTEGPDTLVLMRGLEPAKKGDEEEEKKEEKKWKETKKWKLKGGKDGLLLIDQQKQLGKLRRREEAMCKEWQDYLADH